MAQSDIGWDHSAQGWLDAMGERGDFGRIHVLDAPMLARVAAAHPRDALDVGCGEGRFCRLLRDLGTTPIGIEPTAALRAAAKARDPSGSYVDASAEHLPFADQSFDLVVSYLTLIDIEGLDQAIREMARVLRPKGRLLIANLTSFNTAGQWRKHDDGTAEFLLDHYLTPREIALSWGAISIRNWHRPLSTYMQLLLGAGLQLTHFDEPSPTGGDPDKVARYRRSPYFHIMEWQKP